MEKEVQMNRYDTRQARMFGDVTRQGPYPDKSVGDLRQMRTKLENKPYYSHQASQIDAQIESITEELRIREDFFEKMMGKH